MIRVSFYGNGQVSNNTAAILRRREDIDVLGPFGRAERAQALTSGVDVVVIATTSFLVEIADDVRDAVESGSNVITTAEEAAQPWANDPAIAGRLDALAKARGVTVLGAGLNPGFAFDALVLTVCGAAAEVESLRVSRVVDLSGFGRTVLRRIGVGHSPDEFEAGERTGTVTGHIGFPQSMRVVADRLGVEIDRIDRQIEPIFAERELTASSMKVEAGQTAGFRQHYVAIAAGRPWFEAIFTGHVAPREVGLEPRDEIVVEGSSRLHFAATPSLNPQSASAAIVANSIRRVVEARPGWVTVGELPPGGAALMKLDGRVAIVTGGAGSIGSAIARRLDDEGATVAVADLRADAAEEVAATLKRGMPLVFDVSSSAEWEEAVARVVAEHGRLDVLVNNAGTHVQALVEDLGDEEWDRVIRTNAYSVFYGCRAALPPMRVQGKGAIVNIVTGQFGVAYSSAYTASKFLVHGFSQCLVLEIARYGIRVNCLAPGAIPTTGFERWYREKAELLGSDYEEFLAAARDSIPLQRFGSPEDIAAGVLYLASDESAYVTGQLLGVDGGFSGYAFGLSNG